jgi:murein DD-endopeptidase MepM/ murein hydrolase activator NlpD
MSRLAIGDRLRTIAVTAILTSVGWLAFGGSLMDSVGRLAVLRKTEAATGAGSPPTRATDAPLQRTTAQPIPRAAGGEYVMPVAGVRPEQLTDTFTAARGGGARVHDAIDIMAPRGTPVLAAADGTVEKLFTSDLGGLTIYVRSPDRRTITYYAHLDGYAPGLAEKQQVTRGQRIGFVGSTGNAGPSGPQLHFAIMQTTPQSKWWEPSVAVNPYPLLAGGRR